MKQYNSRYTETFLFDVTGEESLRLERLEKLNRRHKRLITILILIISLILTTQCFYMSNKPFVKNFMKKVYEKTKPIVMCVDASK